MKTAQTFPEFAALPWDIRRDIWVRAVDAVLTTPSVQIINISKEDSDEVHEDGLISEAVGNPTWSVATIADDQKVNKAIRNYRSTLVQVAPHPQSRFLSNFSPFWTLRDVLMACTDAYESSRQRLEVIRRSRRESDEVSALFDPTRDIVCLEGPEADPWIPAYPFFVNCGSSTMFPDRQAISVVPRQDMGRLWREEFDKCPSLREISRAISSSRRVAFIYTKIRWDGTYIPIAHPDLYRYQVGLDALWPHNMPELTEIYLIDRSIKLRAPITDPRQQLASVPRFAGYNLSTFYEVRVNKTAEKLWDIRTPGGELLPVFKCAAAVRSHYDYIHHNSDHKGPKVAVKVLTVIEHSPLGA
jgi:hypothetical protein